jgi:hypothetical protein
MASYSVARGEARARATANRPGRRPEAELARPGMRHPVLVDGMERPPINRWRDAPRARPLPSFPNRFAVLSLNSEHYDIQPPSIRCTLS